MVALVTLGRKYGVQLGAAMATDQNKIAIVPASQEYLSSFRDCLDSVARERRWLMTLEAHPLEQVREYWSEMFAANDACFFAVDGERVVGWIDIKRHPEEGICHRGRLGMGILRDYRGRGIGTQLMAAALEKAKKNGLMRVELTVYDFNATAVSLYRKSGFVEEGRMIKARYLDGRFEDIINMALIFPENLPAEAAK
jgi:GNAT superfamily N-acetyltransferase